MISGLIGTRNQLALLILFKKFTLAITKPTIYTRDYVANEVSLLLEALISDEKIIYKGELFTYKPYSRQRYSEWKNQFADDEQISDTIEKIEEILESRAVAGAMKNELSANFTKFHMINNYGWKDKSEVENTGDLGITIKTINYADDEGDNASL